jgi:hypothetical protein
MGIFKSLFLKGESKIQIIKDGKLDLQDICYQNGLEGVYRGDLWTSIVDLSKDEDVQIEIRYFRSPVAVVPSQGYTKCDNHSKMSIQWWE